LPIFVDKCLIFLPYNLSNIIIAADAPVKKLEIEVTETELASDKHSCIDQLDQLHKFGLSIAMDDFGTGYSSLSYLNQFPIDKIKIDKSFIDNICTDKNNRAIVSAIAHLSQDLDLTLVIEGVEDAQQEMLLKMIECKKILIQGYFYSKPLPEKDFIELLVKYQE
jgi:EAL domain-containing protein (putative c-di-GMP-specific phosphodiesterase class I)